MALYITDTHALVWYLGGSTLLSATARSAFDETTTGVSSVLVPAIVIAELVMLTEKRKSTIDVTRVFTTLRESPGFFLTALTPDIAFRTKTLTTLPDIHDRLIVAEAIETSATLITRDQMITASGLASVVW